MIHFNYLVLSPVKKDRTTSMRISAFGESGKCDMQKETSNGVDTTGALDKIDDLYNEDTLEKCRKEFEKMSSENCHLKNKLRSMQEELNEYKKQLASLQQRPLNPITPFGEAGSIALLAKSESCHTPIHTSSEKYSAEQDIDGMDPKSGGSKCRLQEQNSSDQIKCLFEEMALLQLENDRLIAENEALRLINDSLPSCDSGNSCTCPVCNEILPKL